MKVSFKIIFSIVMLSAGLSKAHPLKNCLQQHEVEGYLFLREDKKIELVLNKNTHKEILIEVKKYDQLSYSCALEGCKALVAINISKKKHMPRHYYAKELRFLNIQGYEKGSLFDSCGYK